MRIPLAFPNMADDGDPTFAAFALLSGTLIEAVSEREMDNKKAIVTLFLATRPGATSTLVDFSSNLNARVGPGLIERLGLPSDTEFKAAGLRYNGPDGSLITELLCVGVRSEELQDRPPPDCPQEVDAEFNGIIAEAAAEAGFVISAKSKDGEVVLESPGIDAALNTELTKQIEAEAAKFRAELDSVFDTWKGGTT